MSPDQTRPKAPSEQSTPQSAPCVRIQYESYPYPPRTPAEEDRRLITGSPSHLAEVDHYLCGGRLGARAALGLPPYRVLVAGGGTGDVTVMLAQQLADRGCSAKVVHLDLSDASTAIARARVERRSLTNVTFRQGSLLDAESLGMFDYIDCCGVLHHLDEPLDGLKALGRALAPGGGMGLMVYAPLGRTGVYPLQAALRPLTAGLSPQQQVATARRLLQSLPRDHWLLRNPLLSDHLTSDAGLYDLLLHSRDRAYTVDEFWDLIESAGLAVRALVDPLLYQPKSYIKDPRLLKTLEALPARARAAWAEQAGGVLGKHIAYVSHQAAPNTAPPPPVPESLTAIPVLREIDGPALAHHLRPGQSLDLDWPGLSVSLPLPRLAPALLARINGTDSLGEIRAALAAAGGATLDEAGFLRQFQELFAALSPAGKLFLRLP